MILAASAQAQSRLIGTADSPPAPDKSYGILRPVAEGPDFQPKIDREQPVREGDGFRPVVNRDVPVAEGDGFRPRPPGPVTEGPGFRPKIDPESPVREGDGFRPITDYAQIIEGRKEQAGSAAVPQGISQRPVPDPLRAFRR